VSKVLPFLKFEIFSHLWHCGVKEKIANTARIPREYCRSCTKSFIQKKRRWKQCVLDEIINNLIDEHKNLLVVKLQLTSRDIVRRCCNFATHESQYCESPSWYLASPRDIATKLLLWHIFQDFNIYGSLFSSTCSLYYRNSPLNINYLGLESDAQK